MVVLVPDVATRDAVRALASSHPVEGLHASVVLSHDEPEVAVRDTRRSLFQGPLAVLARNDAAALRALAAGADEAFSLTELTLDFRCWRRLIERAELQYELRQEAAQRLASLSELEKLCALGRLVSGVAEELTGPLQGAQVALEALKRDLEPLYAGMAQLRAYGDRESPSPAQLRAIVALSHGAQAPLRAQKVLAEVGETCDAISQVARDLGLHELGLPDAHERPQFVDLRDTLDGILRLFTRGAAKNTHVERDYCAELPELMVPRGRVAQALISLISNALANVHGAQVQRLRIQLRADDAVVTVTVSDNGQGRSASSLDHFFEPGASAAQAAGGLELAAARNVMRSLGGDLLVESLRGSGSTFVAWLPRPKQHELRPSGTVRKPDAMARDRRRSVLVVEPDRQVLAALSHLLRERYDVLLAQSGQEARALLAGGTRPDAIVAAADDTDSRKFVEWVLVAHADLTRRLLITSDLEASDDALIGLPWLEKPLEPAALTRAIEARFAPPLRKTGGSSPRLPRVAKGG